MSTVDQIHKALFDLAPAYMKESWDNVGLLCGHGGQEVSKILVALDPFMDVAKEAKAIGAQLIVTHHPLIFSGIKAVNDADLTGRTLLYLIENGIAAINLHTNLDSAPGGVNDCLADALGLTETSVLVPAGEDEAGRVYGLGRYGVIAPCTLADFLKFTKDRLGCYGLRYVDGGKRVHKVAVGGGTCGDFLPNVAELKCDTFVTADVKYNLFATAREWGINLIDAGHFETENPVCAFLAKELRLLFPDIEVELSRDHHDVTKFLY